MWVTGSAAMTIHFGGGSDPASRRISSRKVLALAKNSGAPEPVDHQAGQVLRLRIAVHVVVALDTLDPAEPGFIRPPGPAEDVEDGQRHGDRDPGQHAQQDHATERRLIFEKTSTRTRSAFEVASYDQGAHVTYLDPSGSQLGHKESVADTAAVLGRMYDAIEFRGNAQADVEELAAHAGVPVYNGLTDEWHPTQMLADFLTMGEASGKPYDRLAYAFAGDCGSTWAGPCWSLAR